MTKVSIIIPAYNEEENILELISEIKKLELDKEIIVVDDGSKDKTAELIKEDKEIILIQHEINLGRGGAVKTGINFAKGEIICIQDADMEQLPSDIPKLIDPILKNEAEVVYVNRLSNPRGMSFIHLIGNKLLSLTGSILYGQKLTDVYGGSKCFKGEVIKSLNLKSNGFEQEAELLAKISKMGIKIREVNVDYNYRKHGNSSMKLKDGFNGIFTMIKYYFKK